MNISDMREKILIGLIVFGVVISVCFFFAKNTIASGRQPCDTADDCGWYCDIVFPDCSGVIATCPNDTCSCRGTGCTPTDYSCGYSNWYDCSDASGCWKCRDILVTLAEYGCQPSGGYEIVACGDEGGTDSSCGNALPPGCIGVCGGGTHCANDSGSHSCTCKTNHTCAEFLAPLHWPKIIRTSETTVFIYWDPYSEPARGADTLSISVYPQNINPGFGCNGCFFNQENIDPYITGYVNVTGLSPGTLYTMRALYQPIALVCGGKVTNFLSSCTMTPDPLNLLSAGNTGTLTTNLNLQNGQSISITYESSLPAVATVSNERFPLIFTENTHTTTATAVSNGSTTVSSHAEHVTVDNEGQLAARGVCNDTAIVNVGLLPTNTPTPTRTPTPTPTTAPNNPWIKLKDTSYISKNNLNNIIPAVPIVYDGDDTGEPYFIIGSGGVVTPINLGANPGVKADSPEYKATGVSPSFLMTPNVFLSYIKARKQHTVITNPDLSQITGPGIYVYNGSLTLDSSLITNSKVVLIATGNITISGAKFNSSDCLSASKSIAIISSAGQISFSSTTQCAAGIFVADNISTGTNTALGLKVIGNLVAQTSLANDREWADPDEPSLFVKFDPTQYIDLLPYLSTANYDWRQIQ